MAVNAQHLITLSIGKIAGSRTQRGGICLRKNLLVASVLSSARAYYYEEMCNKMQEHASSIEEEYDISNSTSTPSDWDKKELEESSEQSSMDIVTTPCDEIENPPQEASCGQCNVNVLDKENQPEQSIEFTELKSVEMSSCDTSTDTNNPSQRQILSDCTAIEQNVEKSCKRKRSEIEEACDSILPKKVKTESDSIKSCNTGAVEVELVAVKSDSSNISSLVNIFRSGLQGLSGDVPSQSAPANNHYSLQRPAFVQGPISIAAC